MLELTEIALYYIVKPIFKTSLSYLIAMQVKTYIIALGMLAPFGSLHSHERGRGTEWGRQAGGQATTAAARGRQSEEGQKVTPAAFLRERRERSKGTGGQCM